MNEVGSVNSQMLDAVTGVVTLISGQAPSHAFGLLDTVMAETLGMAMHNAVHRQQGAGMINSAAVTAACAKILSVPFPVPPPPVPPTPPTPSVNPLPAPPPPLPPSAAMAAATIQATQAIETLKGYLKSTADTSQTAQADLNKLIAEAGGTVPTPVTTAGDGNKQETPAGFGPDGVPDGSTTDQK